MLDINGGEFVVLVVLAVLLVGPERLPKYAAQLGALVRRGKVLVQDAKARVDTELGDDFKDVDWSKLDPRQYDPRRIVRDALLDDAPTDGATTRRPATAPAAATPSAAGTAAAVTATASASASVASYGASAPYDDEAT